MNNNAEYSLFLFKQAPYSSALVQEGYDALFAFAAFDQPVKVLFWGYGALHLLPSQQQAMQGKSIEKQLMAFDMYDIPTPFLHGTSSENILPKGVELSLPCKALNNTECRAVIDGAKRVFSF